MEVVHAMLADVAPLSVDDQTAGLVAPRPQTPLHALADTDVLGLEHVVDIFDCIPLLSIRFRSFEIEVLGLEGPARSVGQDMQHHHVAAAGETQEADVGP